MFLNKHKHLLSHYTEDKRRQVAFFPLSLILSFTLQRTKRTSSSARTSHDSPLVVRPSLLLIGPSHTQTSQRHLLVWSVIDTLPHSLTATK